MCEVLLLRTGKGPLDLAVWGSFVTRALLVDRWGQNWLGRLMEEQKQSNWRPWMEATLLFNIEAIPVCVYADGMVLQIEGNQCCSKERTAATMALRRKESSAQVEALFWAGSINKRLLSMERKSSIWVQKHREGSCDAGHLWKFSANSFHVLREVGSKAKLSWEREYRGRRGWKCENRVKFCLNFYELGVRSLFSRVQDTQNLYWANLKVKVIVRSVSTEGKEGRGCCRRGGTPEWTKGTSGRNRGFWKFAVLASAGPYWEACWCLQKTTDEEHSNIHPLGMEDGMERVKQAPCPLVAGQLLCWFGCPGRGSQEQSGTSSSRFSWKIVRNANSRAPYKTYYIRACVGKDQETVFWAGHSDVHQSLRNTIWRQPGNFLSALIQ